MSRLTNQKQVGDYSGLYDKGNGEDLYIEKVLDLESLKTFSDPKKYVVYRVTAKSSGEKAIICYMIDRHEIFLEKDFHESNERLKSYVMEAQISFETFLKTVIQIFID